MSRNGLLRNTFIVAALTMLSRVLGLVREMFQSAFIGAGVEQSAFALAFAVPNMVRKLFGEGALTAAFVPVFRGEVEAVGLEKAQRLARAVMTTVLVVLMAVVALTLAALVTVQGFADTWGFSDRTRLVLRLVTILVPYMLAICGAAFGMGVLNALGRFKASGFMPALLNIVWIAALASLLFVPNWTVVQRIEYVSGAILMGGFVQMIFMFTAMRRAGVSPRPLFSGWGAPKVRLVWHNLGIAAFGAGAVQLNYLLDQVLAQWASPWAAGVIGFAERLMDLPLGVIGVAFGTVLLPTFADCFARRDEDGARAALLGAVKSQLFVMVPAAAGLAVLAPEVTRVIYERGEFDALATTRVARALAVYAGGLGFFGLQKSLIPWFQAQNDMRTPLRVSVETVILNATLNLLAVAFLPEAWRHVGLAGSTVLCALFACVLLARRAKAKNGSLGLSASVSPVLRILFSALVMAMVLGGLKSRVVGLGPYLGLALLIGVGALVYFLFTAALFRGELKTLLPARRRRK